MSYNMPVTNYQQPLFGNGGNSNVALQLLLQMVQQAQGGRDQARQANESRYNDILSLLGNNRQRSLDSLDNLSGQQVADANQNYDNMRHELLGKLPYGASRQIPVETATQRERDAAVNRIKDTQLQNRNAADLGFTDRATGVMERRTDAYPQNNDISGMVTQLAGLLGNGGGGFGGGFGGNGQQPNYPGRLPMMNANGGAQYVPQANNNRAANPNDAGTNTEGARRAAMIALHNAIQGPTVGATGQLDVETALNKLIAGGWAQQNPAASQGGFVPAQLSQYEAQYKPIDSGFSSPPPQPQQPTYGPGQNPTYQARFTDPKRRRALYFQSPQYQASTWAAQNGFAGQGG